MAKHGQPDFWTTRALSLVYLMQDMGELAVRNGSPYMLDRRGKVIQQSSFAGGLEDWISGTAGAGSAIYPVVSPCNTPPMALAFSNDGSGGAFTEIHRYIPFVSLSRYGFGVVFSPPSDQFTFTLSIKHQTVSTYYSYSLRYDRSDGKLKLENQTGWTDLATVGTLLAGVYGWHFLKIVIDIEKHAYVRAILQSSEYKANVVEPYTLPFVDSPHLLAGMTLADLDTVAKTGYIDNVVITAEED